MATQYKTVAGPVGLVIERKDSYENAVKQYAAIIDKEAVYNRLTAPEVLYTLKVNEGSLDLDKKTNSLVETLSRGMQQKVALVIALSFASPVVFLDEPTLGLDMETQNQLITFLNQKLYTQQQLFLISSHDLNFVTSTCDNIYLLKNGKLHEYNSKQSRCAYRLKSYAEIHILKPYLQIEETTERIFTYNIIMTIVASRELEKEPNYATPMAA